MVKRSWDNKWTECTETVRQIDDEQEISSRGFNDLEKEYNWVNRESLWLVLGTYDVNCLACLNVKGGEEDNIVEQECVLYPLSISMCL